MFFIRTLSFLCMFFVACPALAITTYRYEDITLDEQYFAKERSTGKAVSGMATRNKDGKVMREYYFDSGVLVATVSYDTNGNATWLTPYKKGSRDGMVVGVYPSKKIKWLIPYKSGVAEGMRYEFYENGQVKSVVPQKADKQNGKYYELYDNGSVKYEEEYRDGKLVGNRVEFSFHQKNLPKDISLLVEEQQKTIAPLAQSFSDLKDMYANVSSNAAEPIQPASSAPPVPQSAQLGEKNTNIAPAPRATQQGPSQKEVTLVGTIETPGTHHGSLVNGADSLGFEMVPEIGGKILAVCNIGDLCKVTATVWPDTGMIDHLISVELVKTATNTTEEIAEAEKKVSTTAEAPIDTFPFTESEFIGDFTRALHEHKTGVVLKKMSKEECAAINIEAKDSAYLVSVPTSSISMLLMLYIENNRIDTIMIARKADENITELLAMALYVAARIPASQGVQVKQDDADRFTKFVTNIVNSPKKEERLYCSTYYALYVKNKAVSSIMFRHNKE